MALDKLKKQGLFNKIPISDYVSAVSVGMLKGKEMLDLTYEEDSVADVDMNIIMTRQGCFIEVQGTAEGKPFTNSEMDKMISLSKKGTASLFKIQKEILGDILDI